jgi:AraC-like DNA-binding protein
LSDIKQLLSIFAILEQIKDECMAKEVKYEQVLKDSNTSFHYGWSVQGYQEEIGLHFHPEIEIIVILKGAGYRMTGDFSEPFERGEVLFVPANLPHCWIYNPESCAPDGNRECIFVQFDPSLLENGMAFFNEWKYTSHKLLSMMQSVEITGKAAQSITEALISMQTLSESERLLSLLKMLRLIGTTSSVEPIGIPNNASKDITKNMRRIQLILKYVVENYRRKISLSEIASKVSLSETAFCAFFKRETGKSFISFVNEYRLEAVCSGLKNCPDKDISQIAWACGFTDIPYFNRYFKKMKRHSPREWRSRAK